MAKYERPAKDTGVSTESPRLQSTGFPSPAADYLEERIDLNKELVRHPLATFFFIANCDSMINAFIQPGSMLVVDRALTAKHGDIVLVVLFGSFAVRYLRKNTVKSWLVPANKKYQEIEVTSELDIIIWGVVTTIISQTKDMKCTP